MWTWKVQQEQSGGASHNHLVKYLQDCQWQHVSNLLQYLLNINWFLRVSSSQSETRRGEKLVLSLYLINQQRRIIMKQKHCSSNISQSFRKSGCATDHLIHTALSLAIL